MNSTGKGLIGFLNVSFLAARQLELNVYGSSAVLEHTSRSRVNVTCKKRVSPSTPHVKISFNAAHHEQNGEKSTCRYFFHTAAALTIRQPKKKSTTEQA